MANEISKISLIIDSKPHAQQFATLLKQNGVEFDIFRPAGETESIKFKFDNPGDFVIQEMNNLFDSWNCPER